MSIALYSAFVAATVLLILVPGPNVALIVSNSVAHGVRYGLLTVAGTSAAMVVQLSLTILGMTALLGAMADWFETLRWIGVAYLIYIGVRAWRAPALRCEISLEPRSRGFVLRGFLVSLTNPKTLLFYSAFLPQFVSAGLPLLPQLVLLSATFLAIAVTLDCTWALAAGRARNFLTRSGRRGNRLTGGLLIGAGVGLALARKS